MILLTPAEIEAAKRAAIESIRVQILAAIDPESIATIPLDVAAHSLGISTVQAAKLLPVIHVGPRTRVVDIADFKAFKERNKKYPKGWPMPEAKAA